MTSSQTNVVYVDQNNFVIFRDIELFDFQELISTHDYTDIINEKLFFCLLHDSIITLYYTVQFDYNNFPNNRDLNKFEILVSL